MDNLRRIAWILGQLGYTYAVRGDTVLVPGSQNILPDNTGVTISIKEGEAVLTLLTNIEVSPENALKLLGRNLESSEYCYAVDPEGFLAIVLKKPVIKVLGSKHLQRAIETLVEAMPTREEKQ